MPYYDAANLVTVTDQYNRWSALWLWNCKNHWCENTATSLRQSLCRDLSCFRSLPQTCAEVSESPKFDYPKSHICSILSAPPLLQVLSGARENALAESEITFQSSREGWEHLQVLGSTGEGYRSFWEVCIWLPDRITICWSTTANLAT